jgi:putative transcriptional regulator
MSLAGSFLVARPLLQDPNFRRTVVLILAHNADGAFGLVVNRPAKAEGLPWPLFVGGPCPSPGLMMLHGHPDWVQAAEADDESESEPEPAPPSGPEVAPGLFIGNASSLEKAGASAGEEHRFRVFSGYAGWSGGQLEGELAAGAWALAAANGDVLFETPFEELWERLAPPRIPQPSMN